MNLVISAGKYVVAVSGGVDSVVLLDLLSKQKNLDLVVAHFDHGIRPESQKDRIFVEKLANKYKKQFFYEKGKLGSDASEATARDARYKFLSKIVKQTKSKAVITAHHQDDVIETALINLLRGTSAKGLGALKSTDEIKRPLLNHEKAELIEHAQKNDLSWVEDETNEDEKYLRNYIRKKIITKFSESDKKKMLKIIEKSTITTDEIGKIISEIIPAHDSIERSEIIKMSHAVALEYLSGWLSQRKLKIDKKTLNRLVIALKTAKPGSDIEINNNHIFKIESKIIYLKKK